MANQQDIQVNMRFNADVTQAKAAMQELQNSLQKVAQVPIGKDALFDDQEFRKASEAATELAAKLQAAFNTNTGKLDLLKFTTDLKSSNKDLQYFKTNLLNAGDIGRQAFLNLSNAIATAEMPLIRVNSKIKEFGTTMINTVKWGVSSGIMNSFSGAVQKAYGYAQDLNKSLTDIRIVTGQSSDQMAKFAKKANETAKALSATTLDYTEGALVYYQQGLDDAQVKERTDLTIKMAQASGQSAQTVSEQLTSVWNNFAKGGENLEHFADVMVRLGADTASSSDEIAEGLQKFASVGETVGLSYDNAAAVLATITDRTRESADTVGTALKTIFARLQGLKLGDTLEDGTDLNKYSKALEAVGVYIKDGNGNLRDMDILIEELGEKWKVLERDEQAALAQTVAGTRQYATFMALMNNYDFYEENLEKAKKSEGSLEEQANIYAESWEAARDRVQAALEDIYTKLINDEFFIDMSNGFEKILEGVSGFIDGLGGVKGMLLLISSIFMRSFANKMPQVLTSLKENLLITFGQGPKLMAQMQQENQKSLEQFQLDPRASSAEKAQAQGLMKVSEMQQKYAMSSKIMSEEDKNQYQQRLKNIKSIYEEIAALDKASEKQKTKTSNLARRTAYSNRNMRQGEEYQRDLFQGQEEERQTAFFNAQQQVNQKSLKLQLRNSQLAKQKQEVERIRNYNDSIGVKSTNPNNKNVQALALAEEKLKEIEAKVHVDSSELDEAKRKRDELAKPLDLKIEVLSNSEIEEKIREYNQAYKRFASMSYEMDSVTGQSQDWVKGLNNGASTNDTKKAAISYINTIKESLKEIEKETNSSFDTKALDKYEKELEECGDDAEELKKIIANFGDEIGGIFEKAAQEAGADWDEIDDQLRGQGISSEKMRELYQNIIQDSDVFIDLLRAQEGAQNIPVSFEVPPLKNSQVLMELGSALMGLQSAIYSCQSAFQVFGDEASTTADKVGAFISIITSGSFAIQGLSQGLQALKDSSLATSLATKFVAAGMTKADAAAASLAATLGIVLAVIAVLAVAIAGVIYLFKKWQASTPEGQLKNTKEKVSQLNDELTKTKELVEKANTAFDGLDDVQKKLSECKKGTEEWNEALKENNDQVLALLQQYPELYSMTNSQGENAVVYNSDGTISIGSWARKELQNKINYRSGLTDAAQNSGNQEVFQKEQNKISSDIAALEDKINMSGTEIILDKDKTILQDVRKLFESTFNNQGTVQDFISQDFQNQILNLLHKKFDSDYANFQNQTGFTEEQYDFKRFLLDFKGIDYENIFQEGMGNTLVEIQGLLNQLNSNLTNNTAALEQQNLQRSNDIMRGYSTYDSSQYQGSINQIISGNNAFTPQEYTVSSGILNGQTFEATDDKTVETQIEEQYLNNLKDVSTKLTTIQEYEALMGEKITQEDGKLYQGEGDNKVEISEDSIAKLLAADQVNKPARQYGEVVTEQVSKLKSQDEVDAFTTGMLGKNGAFNDKLLKKSEKEFGTLIDQMKLSDELMAQLGITSVDSFKQMIKQMQKGQKAFKSLQGTYQNYIAKVEQGTKDNATAEQVKEAEKAAKDLGKELAQVFGTESYDLEPAWINKNKQAIQNFMDGIDGSGEKLQSLLAQDYLIDIKANIVDIDDGDGTLDNKFAELHNKIMSFNNNPDFKIGVPVDLSGVPEFEAACNQIIQDANLTQGEATEYFKKIGYDVELEEVDVPPKITPWSIQNPVMDKDATEEAGVPIFNPVPQFLKGFNTTGGGKALAVKTVTPNGSWGGNVNARKTTVGGNNGSTGTNNGSPSGSGSNKGSSKPKDKKTFDEKDKKEKQKYEDEYDRYRDITEAIDEYNDALSEISDAKDEAFGADKLALMDKEKAKYNQLIAKQKDYIEAISGDDGKGGYLALDQAELAKYGGKFDNDGKLTNYYELTQGWLNDVNAATDAYNSAMENATNTFNNSARDETAEEVYNNAKQAAEDSYELVTKENEKRKEALDKWQKTYDLNEEQIQQLNGYYRELRALNYEKLEYKLEIRVELNESDLADIEHQLSRLSENDYTRSAERIALIQQEASIYKLMADDEKRHVETLKEQYEAGAINQEQFLEGIQNSTDAITDAEDKIREGIKKIGEELLNAFDTAAEKLDYIFEKFENQSSFLDFYKDISTFINGETDYDTIAAIIDTQQYVKEQELEGLQADKKMWNNLLEQQKAEIDSGTLSGEALEEAEKAKKELESKVAEVDSQIQDNIKAQAELAEEEWTNSVAKIAKEWQESVLGEGMTFDRVLEKIDLNNRAQEEILTTTNKIYETNKLINQAEKDINATSNKRAKQAYNEYINKVKQKQEQNELSQFELDLLTAEYEITKAQIALEEAKDAKDTVRLTRDSEGNFGYVYTANQDKVADAEQALADATNNYYNISLDGAKEASQEIYKIEQERFNAIQELYEQEFDTEEQRQEALDELNKYYDTLSEQQKQKYYLAIDGMKETSVQHDIDYDFISINSAVRAANRKDELLDNLEGAHEDYESVVQKVSEKVVEEYGDQDTALNRVRIDTDLYKGQLDNLIPDIETNLTRAIEKATQAWSDYADDLERIVALQNEMTGYKHDTLLKETYKDDYAQQIKNLIESGITDYNNSDVQKMLGFRWDKLGGNDDTNYQELMDSVEEGSVEWTLYKWLRDYKIERTDWMAKIQDALLSGKSLLDVQWMIDIRDQKTGKDDTLDLVKKWMTEDGIAFASGGYTGDWGPEGRMAILHEKELVLNADDTKNILTSVGIIREISKALDNSALWSALGMANLNASYIAAGGNDTLQQEVTIHADFPNVQDHNEIEMAIDNLINAASQYAYRN